MRDISSNSTTQRSGQQYQMQIHFYSTTWTTTITSLVIIYIHIYTVYPKKYAHGFGVLCFVVVMQSFIMNSHEVFIHIHQGCFAGTGAIVRLLQCQWSNPDGYGKISQCITTTKHIKSKTVCIFLGIYCIHQRSSIRTLLSSDMCRNALDTSSKMSTADEIRV